jgi:MFS family permease
MAAMTLVASPLSGWIVGTRGSRLPLVCAGSVLMIACAMLASTDASTPFTWLFVAYVLFGLGFGLVNAPITNAAVSGMPRAQAGVASAIASTSRQVGSTLGVAVVGALVTSRLHGSVKADFSAASQAGWWTLLACGAVVVVLGVIATTRRAKDSARRIAEQLNPEVLEHDAARA